MATTVPAKGNGVQTLMHHGQVGLYVYRDYPERTVEAIRVTSEDKVERMENLLRKIPPPEADWKEELDAVQMLPEDASSILPGGLDTLSEPRRTRCGDHDHAMVRKPRGFRRIRTGLSVSMESQALFNSFKKLWMLFNITSFTSLRPEFWYLRPWNHSRRYVPQGMSLGNPSGDLMPMYILFTSITFFPSSPGRRLIHP
ncbi:hypothetical protein ARMGADRAFT_366439 [Armillaria gallica]|uniref:Uncharacterized protein n=1 Tax=Armillaria gallica TaxID=47427 RepID=A0A2H3DYA4_ARMGA|nr:hypothetical protein ARMGADRAFT_366439 [Armillaria gallica]